MNSVVISGTVHAEPTIAYTRNGKPQTAFELVVRNEDAPQYYTRESILIVGNAAEPLCERLEAGDEVEIQGKLQRGQVVCFKVSIRDGTLAGVPQDARSPHAEGDHTSDATPMAPEPKVRKPRYPKWQPSSAESAN
jgi:hypothetical protein